MSVIDTSLPESPGKPRKWPVSVSIHAESWLLHLASHSSQTVGPLANQLISLSQEGVRTSQSKAPTASVLCSTHECAQQLSLSEDFEPGVPCKCEAELISLSHQNNHEYSH